MECPNCKSESVRDGYTAKGNKTIQRYRCKICGKKFQENIEMNKIPNVLLLDIETAPLKVYTWGVWKQNINPIQVIEDWNIICWSAKWLFHNEMMSECQTPSEAKNRSDKRILGKLRKVLNKADIVIAHNLDKFDLPRINTRLILNGYKPYSSIQTIDTLKVLKRQKNGFSFTYNRLDYIGQLIRNKGKIETDFSLWTNVLKGSKKHLDYMNKYCNEDILLLEEVYVYLRGWIKSHPNLNLYAETTNKQCNNCLGELVENGEYKTPASIFKSYTCKSCGAHHRGRINQLTKKEKENLVISHAR